MDVISSGTFHNPIDKAVFRRKPGGPRGNPRSREPRYRAKTAVQRSRRRNVTGSSASHHVATTARARRASRDRCRTRVAPRVNPYGAATVAAAADMVGAAPIDELVARRRREQHIAGVLAAQRRPHARERVRIVGRRSAVLDPRGERSGRPRHSSAHLADHRARHLVKSAARRRRRADHRLGGALSGSLSHIARSTPSSSITASTARRESSSRRSAPARRSSPRAGPG